MHLRHLKNILSRHTCFAQDFELYRFTEIDTCWKYGYCTRLTKLSQLFWACDVAVGRGRLSYIEISRAESPASCWLPTTDIRHQVRRVLFGDSFPLYRRRISKLIMDIYALSDGAHDVSTGESVFPKEKRRLSSIAGRSSVMGSIDDVRYIWRHCDAVCFDVDSTVCQDEAIDELAEFCGVGKQVADVTRVAMNGTMSFREALTARLNLIKPSRQMLEAYLQANPPRLTPGIQELVKTLHSRCVDVYLVSGGFSRIILPVAKIINVPEENVFANVLQFDENGAYRGFDLSQPTSDSGGKTQVCGLLKQRNGYQRLVMVGDGATDMEACPPADAFIGFGGNQVRESVLKGSRWFVHHFDEMRHVLEAPEKQG